MEELDVGGPLLFSAVLGASHLVVSFPSELTNLGF
jgi:hypothetical protein